MSKWALVRVGWNLEALKADPVIFTGSIYVFLGDSVSFLHVAICGVSINKLVSWISLFVCRHRARHKRGEIVRFFML